MKPLSGEDKWGHGRGLGPHPDRNQVGWEDCQQVRVQHQPDGDVRQPVAARQKRPLQSGSKCVSARA